MPQVEVLPLKVALQQLDKRAILHQYMEDIFRPLTIAPLSGSMDQEEETTCLLEEVE